MPGWLSSLRDLIADASPVRRFMLALLVILPLAALAAAYLWFNPPVYRVLYTQLSDRAGGDVIAALEQLDIPYRLTAADGTIEVPANQLHAARYRLAARGLPKSDDDAQDEVDRAPRFGASSLQEQQRFQRALEIDLARSIQKLEAVELARVHLALPKVSPFLRDAPPATAAVLVRLRPGSQLDAGQVTTIQTLVAAGVPRLKRAEVQVLDPRGVLLGGAAPEATQSQRLALEQDLVRRALAALTPWLGEDRVNVQVTATLEDSETRQTVERVQNVVVAGQGRPLEKTVRTTRVPEGRLQRINAIVILGFDASANEQGRARQMASQALGLDPTRGDTLRVYALPAAAPKPQADLPAATPRAAAPMPAPPVLPVQQANPPPAAASPFTLPQWSLAAAAAALILLAVSAWRRARRTPVAAAEVADFDAELDAVRDRVLADPRVTADVIKLWMRA
ncbi:MAG: flagellar basal-body MS-ring/collar protein FliF [Thiobacillus sp.]|nr:flagellar basal-body MS-ring/collar protein FliF [Thiobacillus sp.]